MSSNDLGCREDFLMRLAKHSLAEVHVPIMQMDYLSLLESGFIVSATTASQESVFFKFFPTSTVADRLAEVELTSILSAEIQVVPAPFEFESGLVASASAGSQSAIVIIGSRHMPGQYLTAIEPSVLVAAVDNVAKIHRISAAQANKFPNIRTETDYQRLLQLYCEHSSFLRSRRVDALVRTILTEPRDPQILVPIHGDLRFENILAAAGKLTGLIDFSDTRRTIPEDELGRLFQYLLYNYTADAKLIQELARTYEKRAAIKLSRRNIFLSVVYNTLFRYRADSKDANEHDLDARVQNTLDIAHACLST